MSDYPTQPPPGGQYPPGGHYPPGGEPTQPAPGGGMPPYQHGNHRMQQAGGGDGGFFAALFDFSFSRFVTPMIVKFVYVLATIVLAIGYVGFVIGAFTRNVGAGVLTLILGAVVVLIYLAFIRMTLEFYFAIVRMSEDVNRRLPGA
jgi:hypothetical protein